MYKYNIIRFNNRKQSNVQEMFQWSTRLNIWTLCRRYVYHVKNLVKIIKYFFNVHYCVVIMSTFTYSAYINILISHYNWIFKTYIYVQKKIFRMLLLI